MTTGYCFDAQGYWIGDETVPVGLRYLRCPKPAPTINFARFDTLPTTAPTLPVWDLTRVECYGLPLGVALYVELNAGCAPRWPLQTLLWCRAVQHVADGLHAAGAPYRAVEGQREAHRLIAVLTTRLSVDRIVKAAAESQRLLP